MFGVALFTFQALFHQAVKVNLFVDVFGNFFVAIFTQPSLSRLVIGLVTFVAVSLPFRVALNDITGRQQIIGRICLSHH